MSVMELTISYIANPKAEIDISPRARKFIGGALVFVLIALLSTYLYFAGRMVSASFERARLQEELSRALISSSEAEAGLIRETYEKNLDFFASVGYIKPKGIEVIERSFNVVEKTNSRHLY